MVAAAPAAPAAPVPAKAESGGLFGWLLGSSEPKPPPAAQGTVQGTVQGAAQAVATPAAAPAPAAADPYLAGQQAFEGGDYITALSRWLPLAQAGNPAAQNRLGLLYRDGRGLPPDRVRALAWLRLAADNGNAEAEQAASNLAQGMSERQRDDAADLARRLRDTK